VIRIGTAGWAIPSRYQEMFDREGSALERYARLLNVVEINSSFHREHREQTYERWAASVPRGFRFSVKVPRALTHEGRLTADRQVLDRFVGEIRGLGGKLGVLLVQLPPSLAFDAAATTRFVKALRRRVDVPLAFEPRHASWGAPRAERHLARSQIARVAADPAPWSGAEIPAGHGELAYFRWHGYPRKYYSDYDAERLASLNRQVTDAARKSEDVWVIFDNTAHGHALGNALALKSATESPRASSRLPPRYRQRRRGARSVVPTA
jgi:uncharacterized protein YecE (DUF72 family)